MAKLRSLLIGAGAVAAVVGAAVGGLALGPPPGGAKGGLPGAGKGPGAPGPARDAGPVVVTTEDAVGRPVRRTVAVVGSLYGRDEIGVSAKVEGLIRRVHRDVGDEVKVGEVLVELDPTDAEFTVAEAQKGLELELAKLGLKEPPSEKFDTGTLPAIARAAAKERHATEKFERARKSQSNGVGSADDFAQADYDFRDAKEAHRQAKLDAETTLATVRQRQAGLDIARQRLKDTRVCVPSPGTYTVKRRVAELQPQLPGDVRVEVIRDQSRFVRSSIDEVKLHLVLAAVLVSLTILLFIRDWRTTGKGEGSRHHPRSVPTTLTARIT